MQINLDERFYNDSLEMTIVGNMIQDRACLIKGLTHLEPDNFYFEKALPVFLAIKSLEKKNIDPELTSIMSEMKSNGHNFDHKLNDMMYYSPSIETFVKNIETLKAYSRLRKAREIISNFFDNVRYDKPFLIDCLSSELSLLSKDIKTGIIKEKQIIAEYIEDYEKKKKTIIPTYIDSIDKVLRGFSEGNIITIAGRPGMGKTTVAVQLAINQKKNHKVGFFSLEMTNKEIEHKIISNIFCHNYNEVRYNKIEREKIEDYFKKANHNIVFAENQNIKIDQIVPMIKQMVKAQGCEIIYIDHLEKLYDHKEKQSKAERFGYMMDRLKTTAQELKIPIVLLQQLNRDTEKNKDNEPKLTDLKSSGAIEEWSDIVLLIHRESYYTHSKVNESAMKMIIGKARFARSYEDINLTFMPDIQTVVDGQSII